MLCKQENKCPKPVFKNVTPKLCEYHWFRFFIENYSREELLTIRNNPSSEDMERVVAKDLLEERDMRVVVTAKTETNYNEYSANLPAI